MPTIGTSSALRQGPLQFQSGAYPFTDKSSFTSVSGRLVPPDAFLDARVYPINGGPRQRVSAIGYTNGAVTIAVSDQTGELCSGTSTEAADTLVELTDSADRVVGMILIDRPRLVSVLTPGSTLEFSPGAMDFVATVMVPNPSTGVSSVRDSSGAAISGDVWFVGEDGVVLGVDGNVITVHLVGDPLFARKACSEQANVVGVVRPLRRITINGGPELAPDEHGDFKFSIGTGSPGAENTPLRISTTEHGVRLVLLGP